MSGKDETAEKKAEAAPAPTPADSGKDAGSNRRRRFLKFSLAMGLVLAIGGIAAVGRSLVSPEEAPPGPPPAKTQTTTQTVTSTETVTAGTGSATSTASTTQSSSTTSTSSTPASPFPRVKVANVSDLGGATTVTFNYPLEDTPNLLAKLGEKAEGGVGPDQDIVAFSQICQHLGCIYGYVPTDGSPKCDSSYKAAGPVGYCCCHGTVYNLAAKGAVLEGPSPRPQPQVTLEYDDSTGDIYAIGMGPPTIFGHDTGSNDVLNDLQGGTLVG